MRQKRLPKVAAGARVAAAALLAVCAGRFAHVTVEAAMAGGDAPPAASAAASASGAPLPRGTDRAAAAPSGTVRPGAPVTATLMVNVRPDRSDVRVDGTTVGQTPLVRTLSCRAGDVLKIEVILGQGAALSFERTCAPGTIKVEGD